ncbi:MAG: TRAP transporter small permease [Proteobacteria bacterium]|nr:TRAP transporter small permease [Pseudomonadota bacterium]
MGTEPKSKTERTRAEAARLAEQIGEETRRQELADPDEGLPRLDRAVNKTVEILGAGVLCTIVGVIFVNAFGRYAFNVHLIWAEELVQLLMPWLAMTGLFLAIRRGTMIRIEYFFDKFPRSGRRILAPAGFIWCVGILIFLGTISAEHVRLFGADLTVYMQAPKGASTVALVIGGFGGAMAFLAILIRDLLRERTGTNR